MSDPTIRELTPDLLDDFLRFFDRDAFTDNPEWADCYCMEPFFTGTDDEWDAPRNRAAIRGLIRGRQAQGLLAYVEGRPVGWCNATPRPALTGYNRWPEYRTDDPERVGAIACFVIAPAFRRRGVARALLDAACDKFRRRGLAYAEGYPARAEASDAAAYHGPLALYLAAGFTPYREEEEFTIVRRALS